MTEQNPLLKKIELPSRRFRLPSKGLFYTDGELDENVKDGEIEVFSMTAVDEISLRSPEYLFNGEAIDRVFKRCIPEVKKPLRLLSLDVDFLLTALRIVSYGSILEINLKCPECEKVQEKKNIAKETEFIEEVRQKAKEQEIEFELAMNDQVVLNKLNNIRNRKAASHPYKINLDGILSNQTTEISDKEFENYSFTLSNSQEIKMTPLKTDSAVMSYQFQNEDLDKDLNMAEDYVAFVIAACILQIDDVNDPKLIGEWSKKLPIILKEELSQKMSKQNEWGTKFEYNLECPDCNHVRDGNALLNPITFFILPSDQEDQKN